MRGETGRKKERGTLKGGALRCNPLREKKKGGGKNNTGREKLNVEEKGERLVVVGLCRSCSVITGGDEKIVKKKSDYFKFVPKNQGRTKIKGSQQYIRRSRDGALHGRRRKACKKKKVVKPCSLSQLKTVAKKMWDQKKSDGAAVGHVHRKKN